MIIDPGQQAWYTAGYLQSGTLHVMYVRDRFISDISPLKYYKGGIYNNLHCNNRQGNHAMAAVGYGSKSGRDYWTVKNSWGTGWGDKGYVYMTRNRNNQCGIANSASYPNV